MTIKTDTARGEHTHLELHPISHAIGFWNMSAENKQHGKKSVSSAEVAVVFNNEKARSPFVWVHFHSKQSF